MDILGMLGITVTEQGLQMNTNTMIIGLCIIIVLLVIIQRKVQ